MSEKEIIASRVFVETFVHPKTDDLSMDIHLYPKSFLGVPMYCGDGNSCDGYDNLEEARKSVLDILQSYYDGSYYDGMAEDAHYAQQERWATGGGDY